MINGEIGKLLYKIPSNLKILDADVNWEHEVKNIQQNNLSLFTAQIGAIPKCILKDKSSVFCFQWIYQFLCSVSQLEYTHQYPPIELKICKFRNGMPDNYKLHQNVKEELFRIAEQNKLHLKQIKRIGMDIISIQVRLKDQQLREIILFLNEDDEQSLFQINGVEYKLREHID
ncbi:hypothetical protein FGO68_gene5724 [Halteria grandinella]|uniref:Uncharacterized protein n=1 Tax=Halteria grandinella TaxID=5974 RepID=A0A8J8NG79_HALGN|nr:hypothetical protein FGO68_gene5724 [Halteria grandinella]